jgi:hypothetical protein
METESKNDFDEKLTKIHWKIKNLEWEEAELKFQRDWEQIFPTINFGRMAEIGQSNQVSEKARLEYELYFTEEFHDFGKRLKSIAESYYKKKFENQNENSSYNTNS